MITWTQRKLLVFSFASAMVFLLSRVLTLALIHFPTLQAVPITAQQPAMKVAAKRHANVKRKIHAIRVQLTRKIEAKVKDFNSVHLNSNLHDFNIIFSGQVLCGIQPCPAELEITGTTPRNDKIRRVIKTMEDGNYWIQVPVNEVMNEHIDWKVMARNADGLVGETHGRDILSDDSAVSIDAPLTLH
jgi:hypothetical protein